MAGHGRFAIRRITAVLPHGRQTMCFFATLDEFALLEALDLYRSLEHRGKILRLITHSTLLVMMGFDRRHSFPRTARPDNQGLYQQEQIIR